ncbi:MAG: hypothetical protein LBS63_03035 [Prevotellaceae bacterium]|jgi:hypothetical protein|nr:hypothetical protein [Prevotellaceae bacterium]
MKTIAEKTIADLVPPVHIPGIMELIYKNKRSLGRKLAKMNTREMLEYFEGRRAETTLWPSSAEFPK